MGYPELYSDERIILQAQNVKVKSVAFEAILTTRRLILVDTKKNTIPPQEINLATLRDVEPGENAIRDPTITISIITVSGSTRQMILTFSKAVGGERRRESDDWVKALRMNLSSSIQHPVSQPAPVPPKKEAPPQSQPPVPGTPAPQRRIEVTNAPLQKKKIEIARPMKKVVEPAPQIPVPVETSSLPTGSFCNRCGSRVPPESAFCNRCGTPVVKDEDLDVQYETPAPVLPQDSVQQIHIPARPDFGAAMDKRERPIEEVIHSIEPLIKDSVPRKEPSPLVPGRQPHVQSPPSPAVPSTPSSPYVSAVPVPEPEEANPMPGIQWPVLTKSDTADSTASPLPVSPVAPASTPLSPPPAAPWQSRLIPIAIAVLVILAIIAGIYLFANPQNGTPGVTPAVTTGPSATPTIPSLKTTVPTPVPTTLPAVTGTPTPSHIPIPDTGVWVRVQYAGTYTGTVGTPGVLLDVKDTGEHLYRISTTAGVVVTSLQKVDGFADELTAEVYKDGVLIKRSTTVTPKGIIEIQLSLKAPATPSPVPAGANSTGSP